MLSGRVQRCPAFSVFTNSRSISARDATLCKRNGPFQDRPARHVAHDPIGVIIVLRRNMTNARSPTGRPKSKVHLTDSMAAADIPAVGMPAADIAVAADIAAAVVWWPRP